MIAFLLVCSLAAFIISRFGIKGALKTGLVAGSVVFFGLALLILIGAP